MKLEIIILLPPSTLNCHEYGQVGLHRPALNIFLSGNPGNMCIGTTSFVQGWQLFSESQTDTLSPEMERHGLNYLETNTAARSAYVRVRLVSVPFCKALGILYLAQPRPGVP